MTVSRLAFVLFTALPIALATSAWADHHEASELAEQPKASELAEQPQASEPAGQPQAGDGADASATSNATAAEAENSGTVARATFARAISEREPSEPLGDEASASDEVVFFTELRDFDGETITHRWEWNGQVMAEVPFQVAGPRWRVWSTKKVQPEWLGTWTVTVLDSADQVLATETVTLHSTTASTPPGEAASAPPASPSGE